MDGEQREHEEHEARLPVRECAGEMRGGSALARRCLCAGCESPAVLVQANGVCTHCNARTRSLAGRTGVGGGAGGAAVRCRKTVVCSDLSRRVFRSETRRGHGAALVFDTPLSQAQMSRRCANAECTSAGCLVQVRGLTMRCRCARSRAHPMARVQANGFCAPCNAAGRHAAERGMRARARAERLRAVRGAFAAAAVVPACAKPGCSSPGYLVQANGLCTFCNRSARHG